MLSLGTWVVTDLPIMTVTPNRQSKPPFKGRVVSAFIRVAKATAVILIVSLSLVLVAVASPRAGAVAGGVVALIGIFAYFRPISTLWIRSRVTACFLIGVSALTAIVSVKALQVENHLAELEAAERTRANLERLKKNDPQAYLAKLRADNDNRWENELRILDGPAYEKLISDRRAGEEQRRTASITKLLNDLRITDKNAIDAQFDIYDRLASLEPTNPEYKVARERLEKDVRKKRDADYLLTDQIRAPIGYVDIENYLGQRVALTM